MKRVILASTSQLAYDKSILQIVPEQGECKFIEDAEEVYAVDPEFFDTFASKISAFYLHDTDRRKNWYVYLEVKVGKVQTKTFSIAERCPCTEAALEDAVSKLKGDVIGYFEEKYRTKQYRSNLKQSGKKLMSANQYAHKVIKDELGVSHSFYYSDTGKTQYMLHELPFTDCENMTIDVDAGEKFKQQFLDILNNLSEQLNFKFYDIRTPLGGSFIRGCFSFKLYGPDVVYDTRTGEVSVADM